MNQKLTLLAGALLGGLGVALGAMGAHSLQPLLKQNGRVETFETAVKYHIYHALGLLILGLLMDKFSSTIMQWSSATMLAGVILFSGSLYMYAFTNLKVFAHITPVGGLFFLAGWILLVYAIAASK